MINNEHRQGHGDPQWLEPSSKLPVILMPHRTKETATFEKHLLKTITAITEKCLFDRNLKLAPPSCTGSRLSSRNRSRSPNLSRPCTPFKDSLSFEPVKNIALLQRILFRSKDWPKNLNGLFSYLHCQYWNGMMSFHIHIPQPRHLLEEEAGVCGGEDTKWSIGSCLTRDWVMIEKLCNVKR